MLDRSEFMPLQYFKKQKWSGSYQGMRFMFQKKSVVKDDPETKEDVLEVVCWKEPFSYECTPEDEKTFRQFPLSEEGREQGIAWLEQEYENRMEEWKAARKWDWEK